MFYDEIVEEIRRKRREHAAKFDFDLRRIVNDLNKKQRLHKRKTVSFAPKTPKYSKMTSKHLGHDVIQDVSSVDIS